MNSICSTTFRNNITTLMCLCCPSTILSKLILQCQSSSSLLFFIIPRFPYQDHLYLKNKIEYYCLDEEKQFFCENTEDSLRCKKLNFSDLSVLRDNLQNTINRKVMSDLGHQAIRIQLELYRISVPSLIQTKEEI
jgi:hypothetical protein